MARACGVRRVAGKKRTRKWVTREGGEASQRKCAAAQGWRRRGGAASWPIIPGSRVRPDHPPRLLRPHETPPLLARLRKAPQNKN